MTYDVSTPVFEGPFDLLLHLILREQVDIYEVSLAAIVTAYLVEVEKLQSIDLDLATEFLLIASTLVELLDELPRAGQISFRRLTSGLVERLEVIVRFLALLEMFKQGLVELDQTERFGDIDIIWVGQDVTVSVGALAIDDYEG